MSDQTVDVVASLSDEEAASMVAELPVWTLSVAELESWDAARLYAATTEVIEREGRFHPEWAQRLDEVLTVRVVDLISTRHSTLQDIKSLQLFIGLLANDEVRDELDAMPAHYAARWQALSDSMAVLQNLRDFRAAAVERAGSTVHVWDRVSEHVLQAGASGASWQELAEVIKACPNGPKSKGGISHVLTAMQGKGLLESVQRGRCKSYMAGHALHRPSGSAQARSQPGPVIIPTAREESAPGIVHLIERYDVSKGFKSRLPIGVLQSELAQSNKGPLASAKRRRSSASSEKGQWIGSSKR